MRKVDGAAKATGEAVYTDDIVLQGWHGKTLRSPHRTRASTRIDTTKARSSPASTAS